MSSVGFTGSHLTKQQELERLREAYDSLKDVLRGLTSAQQCLDAMNFGTAKAHLTAASWHTKEAQKQIRFIGQQLSKIT
jgi:predicted negative regulator of RcsB-dependent stress response